MTTPLREALSDVLGLVARFQDGIPPSYEVIRSIEDAARAALAAPDEGRGYAEGRDAAASIVKTWHISKGGFSELEHAIRSLAAPASPEPEGERADVECGTCNDTRWIQIGEDDNEPCPECGHEDGPPASPPSPAPATCSGCGHVRDSGADGEEGLCSVDSCEHDCNEAPAPSPAPEAARCPKCGGPTEWAAYRDGRDFYVCSDRSCQGGVWRAPSPAADAAKERP